MSNSSLGQAFLDISGVKLRSSFGGLILTLVIIQYGPLVLTKMQVGKAGVVSQCS